jgi:hypothetical protein
MRLIALTVASGMVCGALAGPAGAQVPAAPPPSPTASEPARGMKAAAVAVNIVRAPGKVVLCGLGVIAGGGVLLLTFGTQYGPAGALFREGCGGKWLIDPSDLDRDVDPPRAIFSGDAS